MTKTKTKAQLILHLCAYGVCDWICVKGSDTYMANIFVHVSNETDVTQFIIELG